MCTAITFQKSDHYFGRNLDLERSYNETVTITPRNYCFHFRNGTDLSSHYAMVGVAAVRQNFPLYFEATNENGLSMAGLNFPGNACYFPLQEGKINISPFELIPWILANCANLKEATAHLSELNLWDTTFSSELPLSPLHWLVADQTGSVVVESTSQGLTVYENPLGVLTNNPPFPYHLHNFTNYMQLTHTPPFNRQPVDLYPYSLGMGSFGLPGDMSSGSRFVKAAFTKLHSQCQDTEESAVSQFFHILGSVCQQQGMTQLENGTFEYTLYSSCCNTDKGIFYYNTYGNSRINAVNMHREDLNGQNLIQFPLLKDADIRKQN